MGMIHFVSMTILLILLFATVYGVDFRLLRGICVVAGMVMLMGGIAQKYGIILNTNLLRELSAEDCANRLTP
jgi:hypothetical protein